MHHKTHYGLSKDQKAIIFSFFLMAILFSGLIGVSLSSTDPIVLGTEKNTNGLVEYLCLGTVCDRLY